MRKKLQALVDALKGEPKHGTLEFAYRDALTELDKPEVEHPIFQLRRDLREETGVLCQEIEKLDAGKQQTAVSILAQKIYSALEEPPAEPVDEEKI